MIPLSWIVVVVFLWVSQQHFRYSLDQNVRTLGAFCVVSLRLHCGLPTCPIIPQQYTIIGNFIGSSLMLFDDWCYFDFELVRIHQPDYGLILMSYCPILKNEFRISHPDFTFKTLDLKWNCKTMAHYVISKDMVSDNLHRARHKACFVWMSENCQKQLKIEKTPFLAIFKDIVWLALTKLSDPNNVCFLRTILCLCWHSWFNSAGIKEKSGWDLQNSFFRLEQ